MSSEQSRDQASPKSRDEEARSGRNNRRDGGRPGDHLGLEFPQPIEAVATVIEIQKHSADLTTERLKSLLNAAVAYGRGLHDMHLAYVDMGVRSLDLMQRATRNLAACRNPTDMAILQTETLREGMDQMLAGLTKVLQASSKAAHEASQPIHDHLKRVVNVDFAA